MTSTFGVDYAWGRPGGAALAAAGAKFAMRYLSNDTTKNLARAEYEDLTGHGIGVGLVWETTARRAAAGGTAGRDDAVRALDQARALHLAVPIYAAVDFDVQPGELGAVEAYFRGWVGIIGPQDTGVYGGFRAVEHIRRLGLARLGWQTSAWSGGQWSPYAALQQRGGSVSIGGVSCDRNTALVRDIGTTSPWPAPTPPTPPAPAPAPATAPPFPGRVLELRSPRLSGSDVRRWQSQMLWRRWRIEVDGVYGPASREVCAAFQRDSSAHGWPLKADGEVGPQTWRAAFVRPRS